MTLKLVCPRCSETSDDNRIDLDVSDGEQVVCRGCDAEFTVSEVRDIIESWGPFLAWLDAHPARLNPEPKCEAVKRDTVAVG